MNEWILALYPVLLFTGLMLAARWQPRSSPTEPDERERGGTNRRSRHR